MVLIVLFLGGAGNVAWGQSDQTTTVNIQRSTSDKNVTLPLGTYKVTVECWGAGGAGGTSTDAHGAAGGGGGGGYAATEYSITQSSTIKQYDVLKATVGFGGKTTSNTTRHGTNSYVTVNDGDTHIVQGGGGRGGGDVSSRAEGTIGRGGGYNNDNNTTYQNIGTTRKKGGDGTSGKIFDHSTAGVLDRYRAFGGGGGGAAGPSSVGGNATKHNWKNAQEYYTSWGDDNWDEPGRILGGVGKSGIDNNPGNGGQGGYMYCERGALTSYKHSNSSQYSPNPGGTFGGGGGGGVLGHASSGAGAGGAGGDGYVRITYVVRTLTVTKDANFDGGGSASFPILYLDKYTTSQLQNVFLNNGFTFVGWNTQKNGDGSWVNVNDDYTSISNSTIYAQWVENMVATLKSKSDVLCYGGTGSATITVTGTVTGSPTNYYLDGNVVNPTVSGSDYTFDNLPAGQHVIKFAKTLNGYEVATEIQVQITQPSSPLTVTLTKNNDAN